MRNNELSTAFMFDGDGWFNGTTAWQWKNGAYLETPDATLKAPWGDGRPSLDVFYRYDAKAGVWSEHQKPHCAADLEGVWISNESMTAHDVEMRELIQEFGKEEGFRIERNDRNDWCVMRVPEPTEEEKEVEALETSMAALDKRIEQVKDGLLLALLRDDKEKVAALRVEYEKLLEA